MPAPDSPLKLGHPVLRRPRLTEKATALSSAARSVYTFEVEPSATKAGIKRAVAEIYKVTPLKINIIHQPAKLIRYRGRVGRRPGGKKALVFLKTGDKIEFI